MCRVGSPIRSQSLLFKYFPVHYHSPVILHSTLCGLRYRWSLKVIHKAERLIDYVHHKYLSHEMDGPGFEDRQVRATSFLQNRPDQFWGSLILRFAGYCGSLSVLGSRGGGLNGLCLKLTTQLHLVSNLRLRGAVPLVPQYAVMARTGAVFLFITERWDFNVGEGQFVLNGLHISYTFW